MLYYHNIHMLCLVGVFNPSEKITGSHTGNSPQFSG